MVKKEYLLENEHGYQKQDKTDYLKEIKPLDKKILINTVQTYGKMNNETLIRHTYINFSYYAINSTIAENVLTEPLYKRVLDTKPTHQPVALETSPGNDIFFLPMPAGSTTLVSL